MEALELNSRLRAVQLRIEGACQRAGRAADSVRLLPVSKTISEDVIRLAYTAGCHCFGENRVQEAKRKSAALSDIAALEWSVIGHLQTNKVRDVVSFAREFQALDSLRVAEALDRSLQHAGRSLDVFIQINTSGEASKYGLPPDEAAAFVQALKPYASLRVRGLMTLAQLSSDTARVRDCFAALRRLRERLREHLPEGMSLDELSMGMSGDFEIAIEEGATVVRVGQAIFGPRRLPDSFFWPA